MSESLEANNPNFLSDVILGPAVKRVVSGFGLDEILYNMSDILISKLS